MKSTKIIDMTEFQGGGGATVAKLRIAFWHYVILKSFQKILIKGKIPARMPE